MNSRALLHGIAAIAAAIAGGTIVFAGLSDIITKDISAASALVSIFINVYMSGTTTGESK